MKWSRQLGGGVTFTLLVFCGVGSGWTAQQDDPGRGQQLYVEYCQQCHGTEGKGWGWGVKVPPPPIPVGDLSNAERMREVSDGYLFQIIKEGGEAVGRTRLMPAAGRVMNDEEIRGVIRYIRTLSGTLARQKEAK
ncbi:MAG: c-type cytochrome [Candidatus Methylomirabilales bacterium]